MSRKKAPAKETLHSWRCLSSSSLGILSSCEEMSTGSTKTQLQEGDVRTRDDRGERDVSDHRLTEGKPSASPSRDQTPATSTCSRIPPTSPHHMTPPPLSESLHSQRSSNQTPDSVHTSRPPFPSSRRKDEREKVLQPALVELDSELNFGPAEMLTSRASSSLSRDSLSLLSRPPSSSFSRSTDLCSGRSFSPSEVMDGTVSSDPDSDVRFSSRHLSSRSSTTSDPKAKADLDRSPEIAPSAPTSPPSEELLPRTNLTSVVATPDIPLSPEKPPVSSRNAETAEEVHTESPTGLDLQASSPNSCATPRSPEPRLSSQRTTPRSRSEAESTASPPTSRLGSEHWPVLPSITPTRGCSTASHCSGISCSQSHMFDDLEANAPPSPSCLSLDQLSDSSRSVPAVKELSPGLAALTVSCESGDLGSISRVQLLLLDRLGHGSQLPSGSGEGFSPLPDWSDPEMQFDDRRLSHAGDWRPLTPGDRSHSNLRGDRSDWSEAPSGSPSTLTFSPSMDTIRSSCSSSWYENDNESSTEQETRHRGDGDQDTFSDGDARSRSWEELDPQMEERKTKAWNMLSKLQEDTPRQMRSRRSRSNFEDFDFLAKYCIFSQEKLAEYKRAFEAEDVDSDGYISCLQVLLALKTIIPAEVLSDQEEIYVYRILEMVDFRVTDGLVDMRLFAVIASLAQKISSMDEFMRSLISNMDFRSLEVRLFKAKLFLFLLEEQEGDVGVQRGFISGEQLLLELKAGGIHLEQEAVVRLELQNIPPLDLLDFLAYLPLFMLIHKSVISNPLKESSHS